MLFYYMEEGITIRNNGRKKGSSRFRAAFGVRQSHLYCKDLPCVLEGILMLRSTHLSKNLQIPYCKVCLSVNVLAYKMVGLCNDSIQLKVALHITFKQVFNRSQVPGKIC